MPAKFEVYEGRSKEKKFYFRLKATNGQTIFTSQAYKSKSSAKKGVESVRKNSAREAAIEVKTAKNGEQYFNMRSINKQIIGTSQRYKTARACKNGIASVAKNAPVAELVEIP